MKTKTPDIGDLVAQYIAACDEERAAAKRKDALSQSLLLLIPPGETVLSVKHIKEESGAPRWKDVCTQVVDKLVPKSKRDVVASIVAANLGKPREYVKRIGEETE